MRCGRDWIRTRTSSFDVLRALKGGDSYRASRRGLRAGEVAWVGSSFIEHCSQTKAWGSDMLSGGV